MATEKQIDALMATGEVGNTRVAANAAEQPYSRTMAEVIIDHQQDCVVCGNGMIVLPWAKVVPVDDRLVLVDGLHMKAVNIHRSCLLEASAGSRIAATLSNAQRPCEWDPDGRETTAEVNVGGKWIGICAPHLLGTEGRYEQRLLQEHP